MHPLRVSLLLIVCLAVTGCGGDDKSTEDKPAPTKAEFVKQASKICDEANKEITAAGEKLGPDATDAEVEELISGTFVPNVRGQVSDIRDLGFPEGDEEKLGAIFDQADQILDDIEADPAKAVAGDDPFTPINPDLEAYGLDACS